MLELINDTLHWLNAHPGWAGLLVFAIALGESLFIVGLFILGTPIMLGFGVLIAFGALELWSTLFWAALGTILGDGISFWLGYYYHDKIRNIWPFTRHPDWLERGEQLIERHGAKSVIFGRLIGATRSFIPITVGMVGMNPLRFHTLDFFATLIWAPSHIFPGVLLGASLTILMDVGTRLTLLVVGVPALIWLSVWIIHQGYRLLVPHTNQFINILLRWSHKNRFFRNLTSGILDPNHPHIIAMLEMGLVLLLATWLLLTLLAFNLSGSTPLEIDSQVYYLFKNLRVPWADPFPIIFNALNSGYSNLAVVLAGLSWLAWKRHWHGVGYWLGSLFFGLLTAWALYQILPLSSPSLHLLTEADTPANGFLESQIMLSTIIYGFIAVLLVRCLPVHLRWRPYAIASSWMLLLILSRLYLAQQWLSDALLGLALGLFWVTVMGLAYRQHHPSVLPFRGLVISILAAQFVVGGACAVLNYHENQQRYTQEWPSYQLSKQEWLNDAWSAFTPYRVNWGGYAPQPITLQWAGDLDVLRQHLLSQGWRDPIPVNAKSLLHTLSSEPVLTKLPVLPQIHDSRYEAFKLVYVMGEIPPEASDAAAIPQGAQHDMRFLNPELKPPSSASAQLVLRLWRSDTYLGNQQQIWMGNITCQKPKNSLGIVSLLSTQEYYLQPLLLFQDFVEGFTLYKRQHLEMSNNKNWNGQVLLMTKPVEVEKNDSRL